MMIRREPGSITRATGRGAERLKPRNNGGKPRKLREASPTWAHIQAWQIILRSDEPPPWSGERVRQVARTRYGLLEEPSTIVELRINPAVRKKRTFQQCTANLPIVDVLSVNQDVDVTVRSVVASRD